MQVIVIDFEGLWHKQSKKYYFQEFAFSDVKSVEAINFFIKRPNDVDITNFEYNERYGNQIPSTIGKFNLDCTEKPFEFVANFFMQNTNKIYLVDGVHKFNIIKNLVPEIKYLYKIQDYEQVLNKPKLRDVSFVKHKKLCSFILHNEKHKNCAFNRVNRIVHWFKLNEDETGLEVCIEPFNWMGNDDTVVDRVIIINTPNI